MAIADDPIRVLYVDDEPDYADTAAAFLEREDDRLSVRTATGAEAGLERLGDGGVDCVVSDYDMPGTNGIEFLELVRETHPELPFILYTGKGSEEIASDAISAGVTDYLQKETGTSQYALLANRISNAVDATQSAAEAKRRRHRLEQILKTVPGCVVQFNREGRFVFANRRAKEVLGLERDELTDRTYADPEWDIRDLDGDPIPEEELPFRRVRDAGEPLYGFRQTVKWPDGTRKTLLMNGAPLYGDDGAVDSVVFSLTDITDQRARENELAETRRRLGLALEATDTGVWEWNLETDAVTWNETLERVMGLDPGEFAGTLDAFLDRVHPDDVADVRAQIDHATETDSMYQAEFRMREKGGGTQWVEVRGQLVDDGAERMVGVHRDITARKRRERRLAAVKSQYQTLVDNFPDGAVFLFDDECRYVRVGGAEIEAVGLSQEEFIGSTPHDFFPEDIADETVEHYREALAGHSTTYEQAYAGNRYRIQTVPVRSEGDVTYGMAVSKNVTEQTEQRQELERQNERLDRFASVVSHDIRSPLNVVDGRLELARQECDSPHLDDAASALDRGFALIDDVLTLAREGKAVSEPEPVDLAAACRSCWRTVDAPAATLSVEAEREISADPARLRQLLENLVRNAVEHGSTSPRSGRHEDAAEHGSTSPRSGRHEDAAEHGSTSPRSERHEDAVEHGDGGVGITVGDLPDGFYVEDDGPGIPPGDREAVFGPGYSTADQGTGFGLRIVEEIAEAHGWTVRATESDAGGARFEITGVERPAE